MTTPGLSFQLYTARLASDLDVVLERLAGLGYAHVEGFGGVLNDVARLKHGLDRSGLSMPSAHIPLDQLELDGGGTIALARTLGIDAIYAPHLPAGDRPADSAGWSALGARLDDVAVRFADAGLRVGWHNHDFELLRTPQGDLPLDLLLEAAPSLLWEADLAWIARAGADPVETLKRHRERVGAIHVKDLAPAGTNAEEDGWADIGEGSLDWPGLIAALRDGRTPLLVAEHDRPRDAMVFAEKAIAAIQALLGKPR